MTARSRSSLTEKSLTAKIANRIRRLFSRSGRSRKRSRRLRSLRWSSGRWSRWKIRSASIFRPDALPPMTEEKTDIRLIDLATQTSGLPSLPGNFNPKDPTNPYADYTPQLMYEFLAKQTLHRKPNTTLSLQQLRHGTPRPCAESAVRQELTSR